MHGLARFLVVLTGAAASAALAQTQISDPQFDARVERPAYQQRGPVVSIDEAHGNFHTSTGRYEPFARLLRNDGYRVVSGQQPFTRRSLEEVDILVVSNAGAGEAARARRSAFTDAEADAVRSWVERGGSLLLIADHAPFGRAAQSLANRFGIRMGEGWVFEPQDGAQRLTTQIDYSTANGRLGDHAIVRGRDESERVRTVRAFTGQSLVPPPGAAALMTLQPSAFEIADPQAMQPIMAAIAGGAAFEAAARAGHAQPVGGRLQGLAFELGRGRVVVLGEAGMLSAQIASFPVDGTTRTIHMGMNVPGNDNRQFALNVMHWLSRLLN
jgi:hypothetical protein